MTAKTVARDRMLGRQPTPVTLQNIKKVTKFRDATELEDMVARFMVLSTEGEGAAPATSHNAEAAKLADKERAATRGMGAEIVPDAVKGGKGAEQAKR